MPVKITQNNTIVRVRAPCFDVFFITSLLEHFVRVNALSNDFSIEQIDLKQQYPQDVGLSSSQLTCDQHQFSANNISRSSRVKVMRVT